MSFFENTRKPEGLGGKIMVAMMNLGHSPVARWGLHFLELAPDAKVLDCGCGGGANMKRLLKKCPRGIVKGIDYSTVSVEKARSLNQTAIQEGRCVVWQGSVERIIFAKDWFDAVTAFETVYFWPDLPRCFREVYRVLKPGGILLICNESNGDTDKDKKWTEIIGGINELARLETWNLPRRFEYAKMYREALGKLEGVKSLPVDTEERQCAYWWFPIILDLDKLDIDAPAFLKEMAGMGIPCYGIQWPEAYEEKAYKELGGFGSHKFPFCSKEYTREGLTYEGVVCPVAKSLRARTVNLFLHPTWEKEHIQRVIDAFTTVHNAHLKK